MIKRQALLAIAAMAVPLQNVQAGEFGINVYGLSYHFDRDRAEEIDTDNEFNPGIGLRYRFGQWNRWSFDVEADVFRDSGRNTATVAGAAALYELGAGFRIGAGLAAFHSDTYNQGDPFIAPIPLVSYDWKAVSLNATFFPKVSNFNDIPTLGFWLTIWPERW